MTVSRYQYWIDFWKLIHIRDCSLLLLRTPTLISYSILRLYSIKIPGPGGKKKAIKAQWVAEAAASVELPPPRAQPLVSTLKILWVCPKQEVDRTLVSGRYGLTMELALRQFTTKASQCHWLQRDLLLRSCEMTSLASLCWDFRSFGKPQMSQSLRDTGPKEIHTVVVALTPLLSGNPFSRVLRELQAGGNKVSMSSPEPWNMLIKQSFQGEGDVSTMYIVWVNMGINQCNNCCELEQSWKYGSNKRNVT